MANAECHQLSPFECCPNEILFHAYSFCQCDERKQQLYAMRLTSRRLNVVFTPFIITERRLALEVRRSPKTWRPYTRLLWEPIRPIREYVPIPAAFTPSISSLDLTIKLTIAPDFYKEYKAVDRIQQLVDRSLAPIWDEISAFISLDRISLHWDGSETDMLLYELLSNRLLKDIRQVTSGRLSAIQWWMPVIFQLHKPVPAMIGSFMGLQKLSIGTRNSDTVDASTTRRQRVIQPPSLLGDLIRLNPNLNSLILHCNSPYPLCTFEELFPSTVHYLDLQELVIRGKIRKASHAQVCDTPHPSPRPSPTCFSTMKNLKVLDIQADQFRSQQNISLDFLSLLLKHCGTQLSHLKLSYGASSALMAYLASYNGLETAHLCFANAPNSTASSYVSFAEAVLPRHAPTLTMLFIAPLWKPPSAGWDTMAIDPVTWPAPSSFRQLSWLEIVTPRAWKLSSQHFQQILECATEIPQLECLWIYWTAPGAAIAMDWLSPGISISEAHALLDTPPIWIKRCSLKFVSISYAGSTYLEGKLEWNLKFPSRERANCGSGEGLFRLSSFLHEDSMLRGWL